VGAVGKSLFFYILSINSSLEISLVTCLKRKNLVFNSSVEPEIYFNRSQIKKWFQAFLNRLLPMNIRVISLFYGGDGAGKTHLLKYIQSELIKRGEFFVAYIDLRKVTSEFDFYMRILSELCKSGFIEELLSEISDLKDALSINQLTGGNRIGWVSKQFGFDPEKIKSWLLGEPPKIQERWIDSPKDNSSISRATLSEILRAFYRMNNRRYPIFLIDHIEDVVGEKARNYMNENAKKETVNSLNTVGNFSTLLLAANNDSYQAFRENFPGFRSSDYYEFELQCLEGDDIERFLSELRNQIVDDSKLGDVNFSTLSVAEKVTAVSYPFTEECLSFIKKLKVKQPGIILSLITNVLKVNDYGKSADLITKRLFENMAKKCVPYNLVVCKNCGLKLKQLDVDIIPRFTNSSRIIDVKCPLCKTAASDLLPLVMRRIVIDTCALVNCCVSGLFEHLPDLGRSNRVTISIPKAVRSELAAMEKRPGMRPESRSALDELRRIQGLARRGQVIIEDYIGRGPRADEIASARLTNSVDQIIIKIAESLDATLITCDKMMAEQSSASGIFSMLFIVNQNTPQRVAKPYYYRR
jgi:hypothetical protein